MSGPRLIATYSLRIVKREWRRFVLPFSSLLVTSIVLLLILLLTTASTNLLEEQAREIEGGDVVIESTTPVAIEALVDTISLEPEAVSEKLSFSATLQSTAETAPFSVEVIDEAYPLYGELLLKDAVFTGITDGALYLDTSGLEQLQVVVGDEVSFGEVTMVVAGEVIAEPTLLFGNFRLLPIAFMSKDSFLEANIDPTLLRTEYAYLLKVNEVTNDLTVSLRSLEESNPQIDIDIAGQNQRGLQLGLGLVSDFLIIAVLVTAVLAAVNVYASILYLVTIERKSLAVLLALGVTKRKLVAILGTALGYVVLLATAIGLLIGTGIFTILRQFIATEYLITLPNPPLLTISAVTTVLIALIAVMSFIPAVLRSLELNPRQILIGSETNSTRSYKTLLVVTIATLLPLVILATYLLKSLTQGIIVIGAIAAAYVLVAGLYALILGLTYRVRGRMSFFFRSIVSQKYTDGLFGVVSFTSLFVALVALSTLALLQISLERFLVDDLSSTIPSTYVLDVQPSQKDELQSTFPEIELFSNTGARIIAIDGFRIQDELAAGNPDVSGELGREFNLTARSELLESETISRGEWSAGRSGEISVDADFAAQANITLGSNLVFLIQGFEVAGTVTSLRNTDSRSGLPFFYFVLSEEDIGMFPSVYFGYANYDEATQDELGVFLASNMPNISVIETQAIGPVVAQLVSTLLVLILVVTLPPLLIATLLIAMLVVSSYATRRREGARFRALGMTKRQGFYQYISETVALTLVASLIAYILGVLVAGYLGTSFLQLESLVLFDIQLVTGLSLIVFFIFMIALYLYKSDEVQLRELLSYE